MALILKTMVQSYRYAINDLADPRTNNWFLVKSPIPIIFMLTCYLAIVFEGPNYMAKRKAFNLRKCIIVYNIAQVIVCSYVAIFSIPLLISELQKSPYYCLSIDYSLEAMPICNMCYIYFVTKIADLLDTVFFVLRKKNNQVTFLHVYHHTVMVAYSWYGMKYIPGGQVTVIGIINSYVHVVMYFYYLLTAYDDTYKKNIWWKKHLTQLQILQFFLVCIWLTIPLFSQCNFPKVVCLVLLPQNFAVTFLFADFYYKTYIRKKSPKVE